MAKLLSLETGEPKVARLRRQLLEWYARNRRDLPWRQSSDPYAIWVSEIMLQQTRVAVVVERYRTFLERFPNLGSLASAPEQDVLAQWSGLGYYRRARMLHKAAQFVSTQLMGKMPVSAEELKTLPGIGSYTAAAIASIAHNERIAVVDGNVERVLCRLEGWDAGGRSEGPALRKKIETLAGQQVDPTHPGDFNQAMMELGATVCTPRKPLCLSCPLASHCKTLGEHKTQPRARMLSREVGHGLVVRTSREQHQGLEGLELGVQEVLLEQRPATQSVMPGLWELPMLLDANVPEEDLRMTLRHAIMQVNYYVRVRAVSEGEVDALTVPAGGRRWVRLDEAGQMALTGLARKVLMRAHLLNTLPKGRAGSLVGRD